MNNFNNSVIDKIKLFMPDNMVIIEAGSAEGRDTYDLAKTFPQSVIYAFEPLPYYFIKASELTSSLKNVKIYNLAIGDENKKMDFFVSKIDTEYHGSSSLFKPKEHLTYHSGVKFPETITVDVVNLNEWCDDNNIEKIDFMWLDLQGYELKVLKTLSKERLDSVSFIFLEVSFIELYAGAEMFNEVDEFLRLNNFSYDLNENFPDAGNYLYIKNKLIK